MALLSREVVMTFRRSSVDHPSVVRQSSFYKHWWASHQWHGIVKDRRIPSILRSTQSVDQTEPRP
jgi:hypothetical protein